MHAASPLDTSAGPSARALGGFRVVHVAPDASSSLAAAADLFSALRTLLLDADVPIDTFQDFAAEVAAVRADGGAYAPARGGALLLAVTADGAAAGCVALRSAVAAVGPGTAEVKRMFVAPPFRGRGVGRALVRELVAVACAAGYDRLVLDTLERLPAALRLYTELGFTAIAPYCANPMPDAVFLGRPVGGWMGARDGET